MKHGDRIKERCPQEIPLNQIEQIKLISSYYTALVKINAICIW